MKERMLSQYLLNKVWETFQDGICITDADGVVLQLNDRHATISGMTRDAMLGRSVRQFLKEGKLDIVLNPEVFATGKRVTRVQKNADGRKIILEANPIKDDSGNTVLCVTFTRDITMLSELRSQITKQKELLDTFQALSLRDDILKVAPKVVHSAVMKKLYTQIDVIAETDATALLLGETGVGKDVFARRIHEYSARSKKPFIKVDCGSIPENLIETELFGYVAGTFSGAHKNGKTGLVEAADGGTLFLDEIGELPMQMQSRLLRLLQDWEIVRVGSTKPKQVDVRIVAATNKNLEESIARGEFRRDLYYRLKVTVIKIPSLSERAADILPMAKAFLKFYGHKYKKHFAFDPEAEKKLQRWHWPGNVRELENLIQGLVVTCTPPVIFDTDLPFVAEKRHKPTRNTSAETSDLRLQGTTFKEIMKNVEVQVLRELVKQYGSIAELSARLDIDRSTIYRKVRTMDGAGAIPGLRRRPRKGAAER